MQEEMKTMLIQSDETTTMVEGSVPVLRFTNDGEPHIMGRVVKAVNFLRCGCSAVQLVNDPGDSRTVMEKKFDITKSFLKAISLKNETFCAEMQHPESRLVIIVHRTVKE